jgi:site-specific recombinase XerD
MKTTNTGRASDGLLTHHIEAFLDQLRAARYSEVTIGNKRGVLSAFSRWMTDKNVAVAHLDESVIASFIERLSDAPEAKTRAVNQ